MRAALLSFLESARIIIGLSEELNSSDSTPLNQNLQAILQPRPLQKFRYEDRVWKSPNTLYESHRFLNVLARLRFPQR
jgi:hypothetical protein